MSRILVFDRAGLLIAELGADCPRSWALNEYGRAQFRLSTKDAKYKEQYIQFGNLLYIEHEKLPAWAGVIDTPRDWGQFSVTVNAYSPEKILEWRRGQTGSQKVSESSGLTVKRLIDTANIQGDTLIKAGDIYTGGLVKQEQINLAKLRDELRRILDDSGLEFTIEPILSGGRLTFRANLLQKAGKVLDYALIEGHNIEADARPMSEQGVIENDILGYTDSATWNNKTTFNAVDNVSLSSYGLRQSTVGYLGQTQQAGLVEGTQSQLKESKNPRKTFNISVIDIGNAWSWMGLGNTLHLKMHSIGFYGNGNGVDTQVRIMGFGFDEQEGKVSLVCDEVIE